MNRPIRKQLHFLVIATILLSFLIPGIASNSASAQGEECPEGLVYLPADDFCVLLEDVPEGAEYIDQHADDSTDSEDTSDSDEFADSEDSEDADSTDEDQTDEDADDSSDDQQSMDDEAAGPIANLTLVTYPCPINWDPATRDIEESHDMCTVPQVPDVTYTILFEGMEQVSVPVQTDVDVAASGIPLNAGMWSIQESPSDGLSDPFAFCAIYAADGSMRMSIAEVVPGGKLDVLLAEGEELNCEWYSVAEVPEVIGDPNALPIGGLTLNGWNCPYGTPDSWTPEQLLVTCIDKGVGGVEYSASLNGAVVSTQIGPGDDPLVDFQKGLDTRLLSGLWTISASLPAEYDQSFIYCSITSELGAVTDVEPETFFTQIDLDLKPGEIGFCNWFNVESEPRTGPALGITLLLHTCPEDFDRESGDYNTCTLPLQGPASFDFIRDGQVMEAGTANAPDTSLSLQLIPDAGTWTIRPALPPDQIEPGWACWGELATGEKILGIDYSPPADGGVGTDAKFGPNHKLVCDVWMYSGVLSEETTGDTAESPSEETTVDTVEVPADEETDNSFGGGERSESTGDGDAEEPASEGSGSTFGGGSGTSPGDASVEPGSVTDPVEADVVAPVDPNATSSLGIQNWTCAGEIVADTSFGDLHLICAPSLEPGYWALNGELTQADAGYVIWTDLTPGTAVVTNTAVFDGDQSVAYCSIDPLDGDAGGAMPVPVVDSTITIEITTPATIYCDWFVYSATGN